MSPKSQWEEIAIYVLIRQVQKPFQQHGRDWSGAEMWRLWLDLGDFFLTAIHSVENLRIASVSPPFIVTRRQPWASCFGPTRTSNQSGLWIQKPGRTMIHPKDPSRQCKVGSSCVEAFFCTQNLIARLIFWFFLNILKHVGHVGLRFDDKPQMLLIAWSWCMTSPPGCAGFRLQASHSSSWVHEDILSGHFTPIASKMFTRIRQRRAWRAAASTWICFTCFLQNWWWLVKSFAWSHLVLKPCAGALAWCPGASRDRWDRCKPESRLQVAPDGALFNKDSKFIGIEMPWDAQMLWNLPVGSWTRHFACAIMRDIYGLNYYVVLGPRTAQLFALPRQKTWPAHIASERRLSCGLKIMHEPSVDVASPVPLFCWPWKSRKHAA